MEGDVAMAMAIPTALEKTCFPQHNISHFSINKL